ncbi:four-carbon acid sugar kinase family protein [Agrococcus sp. Marseille-P2731]|uniref:four-carbon acid sugar kinase family protein n=1 Tax=Agrococcus sp. Marseille-P2731 TaxID=1841862 RepID=UPI000931D80F|nr:four-carbon acid sugar kinase family protein [Agrococcus sp. Marseille-P2731]
MHLDDLLAPLPAPLQIDAADVAAARAADLVLIVLDDDPTGTQSVAGLPVLTRWDAADLDWALGQDAAAVYVLTNTRSLSESGAEARNREVVAVALEAAHRAGKRVSFVSRSDSTLRGHFPLETDVLAEAVAQHGGAAPHLTMLIPAFPDSGRITVDAVHYWVVDDEATPVGQTPFAADATFGYRASDLRDWVEEKTHGRVRRDDVAALTIDIIRAGTAAVTGFLRELAPGAVVVVDAVDEHDMRQVALALHELDREGVTSLLRIGPPYLRAHIGQPIAEPVTADRIEFANDRGGLVVVGSHVPLTTAQLAALQADRPDTATVELDVRSLIDERREQHLAQQADAVARAIEHGTVIVHTSRELVTGADGDASLDIARRVSAGLVELVARVLELAPPRFVIAKGGITSSDVASEALQIRRAQVVGPMLPGIVSLWQPQVGPAVGIPYVVFAGNVGTEHSLSLVVRTLAD